MQLLNRLGRVCSLLLLCSFVLFSCDTSRQEKQKIKKEEKKKYAAVVNNHRISLVELDNEIRFISHTKMLTKKELAEIKVTKEEKKAFLEELINEVLMLQETEKLNLSISKRELQQEINKIIEIPIEAFKKDLSKARITYFDWKERLKKSLKIQKLIQLVITNNIVITDEELREYYDKNIADFFVPSGVEVYQILLKTEAEANIIHQQLVSKPRKWNDLSKDSIANDGVNGYIGFFSRGELPAIMDKTIFSLKKNNVSHVVKTFYGYHIYKVTKKRKARTISFEEARSRIFQLISARKSEKHFQAWLNKVRDESTIVIYDKAF